MFKLDDELRKLARSVGANATLFAQYGAYLVGLGYDTDSARNAVRNALRALQDDPH